MYGTVLDVINGGSIYLLIVNIGGRIVEQPVEPRYMFDMVSAEGLSAPTDLIGREIEMAEDGMSVAFP